MPYRLPSLYRHRQVLHSPKRLALEVLLRTPTLLHQKRLLNLRKYSTMHRVFLRPHKIHRMPLDLRLLHIFLNLMKQRLSFLKIKKAIRIRNQTKSAKAGLLQQILSIVTLKVATRATIHGVSVNQLP